MKLMLVIAAAAAFAGCAANGEPIDISKACVVENDGKNFEIKGILAAGVTVYCSNRSRRMECGFDLLETAGGERKLGADIEVGSGANTMDEVPKGYKKDDLKIRDNAGSAITLGGEPFRLTGKLSVSPDAKACFMQVYKIER